MSTIAQISPSIVSDPEWRNTLRFNPSSNTKCVLLDGNGFRGPGYVQWPSTHETG